jgi:rhamnosyltransferase
MKKIVLGFVVYNPERSFLLRLQQVVTQGFHVFIFDNTPLKSEIREFSAINPNIKYFTVGKNVGLGYGISSICAQAYYSGSSTLLFFDQDTIFNNETLDFIENYYIKNIILEGAYSAVVFSSKEIKKTIVMKCFRDVDIAINSGSLFFLKNLKTLGWHNSRYFVDCVDYEFCLNSKKNNFKVAEYICTPGYDHSTEQGDITYQIFQRNYSFRKYTFSRIVDTLKASIKIIISAVSSGNLNFAKRVCTLLIRYIIIQIVARTIRPVRKI